MKEFAGNKKENSDHQKDLDVNEDKTLVDVEKEYKTIHLGGLYENWFLDYASYVILERAVPDVSDGLKPVQRRILHSMKDLDDGRYNKVANIIGHTMQYHPHGDASIGDALVQLGQKNLLIDTQGNWGNILTGDGSAAPRYIEARLSKFAKEVVFNKKTTHWKSSYDGRKKEPINLPIKFCLLLTQGVEGIAVGLASKILPHNFNEIIDASIAYLQEKEFALYPDFLTGGLVDVSKYNNGLRGGRIRLRARIEKSDKKTLVIKEVPFGTTTSSLIDSILVANDKGKIKIRKIDDNTAANVEIIIHLAPNVSPDQTIDALYAFTQCETSISPNSCVIENQKPVFLPVEEILKKSVDNTLGLLKKELEIKLSELREQWHFSSLEKIFIEKRIYRRIEESESWEEAIAAIEKGLLPYRKVLLREITEDDIIRLTEIKIRRISKYNSFKAHDLIRKLEDQIKEVQYELDNLIDYAINYFSNLKSMFGEEYPRKTEIRNFDNIQASMVAVASQKLYINREEGFAGTGLKKDEFICDCSDIDDVIVFRKDGSYVISKVSNKFFVGKDVIYIDVFKKKDDRTVYNVIYRDGRAGAAFAKRFKLSSVKRDTEYTVSQGNEGSKLLYFSANPNGEAEIVRISLRPRPHMRKTHIEYDFFDLLIKNKSSKGNRLTKFTIRKVVKKEDGVSTLGAVKIYYDDTVRRINSEERGQFLGDFKGHDRILCLMKDGSFELVGFDLSIHFSEDMIDIQKYNPDQIFNLVYFDGNISKFYLKRFKIPSDVPSNKRTSFITEHKDSFVYSYSVSDAIELVVQFDDYVNQKEYPPITIDVNDFIAVKSYSARGKRISNYAIKKMFFENMVMEDESLNEEDV
ncbi:MAG: DNA gyrase/topoisomerase IV subunit A [Bacteroidales bacterium]